MNRKNFFLAGLSVMLSLAQVPAARAAGDGGFSLTFGGEYTTGDYGTPRDTDIWYFPVTFAYESDRASLGLTVSFVSVDGPGDVVPMNGGGGGIRSGRGTGSDRRETGFGDLLLKGSINLVMEDRYSPRIDLTGKAKLGTADRDDNLGTGEDDFSVQADVERNFNSNQLFGSLGYKVLGDPPGVNYDNVLFGSLGAAHRFSDAASAGLALGAQEAVLPGAKSQLELMMFMSARADAKRKLTGYVLRGLRDGSPDWGVGVMVKLRQ
jgi:hypothetical protein